MKAGRIFSLLTVLFLLILWQDSIARAQSRSEMIYDVLDQVGKAAKNVTWENGVTPDSYQIYDLYAQGGACGGYRLVLFVSGKYWGEATLYDCPDPQAAGTLFQSLPYPTETFTAYVPTARYEQSFHHEIPQGDGDLFISDQFMEHQDDGNNYAAWLNPYRNPEFKYILWWSLYNRELSSKNNLLIETMGPRHLDQSDALRALVIQYGFDTGLFTSAAAATNQDPVITSFSKVPENPTDIDEVIFTVVAEDPDGDSLYYEWQADGEAQPSRTKSSATWKRPPAGPHEITIIVKDGKGGQASELLSFYVSEHRGADDTDGDGFTDDEDLCINEKGFIPDGCPPLSAKLGCQSDYLAVGTPLVCSVQVIGAHDGETFEYKWFRDDAPVTAAFGATYAWDYPDLGPHTIQVEAVGDGRSTQAGVKVNITEPGAEAVAGFTIGGLACNSDISSDDTLACSVTLTRQDDRVGALNVLWTIDGIPTKLEAVEGDGSSFALQQPAPGNHLITVQATDPLTNLSKSDKTRSNVIAGRNALVPPIAQTGAAAGTLAAVGTWLWLEWLRNRKAAAPVEEPVKEREIPAWVFDKRKLKDIWAEEASQEISRRGLKGAVYSAEYDRIITDEFLQARLREDIRAAILAEEEKIARATVRLDPSQWTAIEELTEKLTSTNPNSDAKSDLEALKRVMRLKKAVFGQSQAYTEGQAAAEDLSAAYNELGEDAATYVRWGTIVAGLLGPLVVEVPATVAAAAAQAGTAAVINLVGNFVEGTVQGYFEGGANQALVQGIQYTLPVNTVTELYKTVRGDYKQEGYLKWGARIGFSALRDVGNALSLRSGVKGLQDVTRAAKYPPNTLNRAAKKLDDLGSQLIDAEWQAGRKEAQNLIDEFNNTVNRYNNPMTSGAERNAIEKELERLAGKMNSSYQAKALLKTSASDDVANAFATEVKRINNQVDLEGLDALNAQGWRRGGSPLTTSDISDIRNKLSQGSVPMDRDVALNERLVQDLQKRLSETAPGSEEAERISREIMQARKMTELTKNGQKMNTSQFSEEATQVFNQAYRKVTSEDPTEAFIAVTTSQHPEAYSDLNMLQNNPVVAPPLSSTAQQSASVTAFKGQHMQELARQGKLKSGDAIQETFRGLAKDMSQKRIGELLESDPGVPSWKIDRFNLMRRFYQSAGEGKISPGKAVEILNNNFDMDLDGAIENVAAEMEAAIRFRYSS